MSEKPTNLHEQREFRIKRLKTALTQHLDAFSGGQYTVKWLNEDSFSLQKFEFEIELPNDMGFLDSNGYYTTAGELLEQQLPELEDYVFDEDCLQDTPLRIRFVKKDSIAMQDL